MLGIILGGMTIKYMGISRINWIYKKPKATSVKHEATCSESQLLKALSKFKPDVLIKYDWAMFGSLKRYLQVWFYIWFVLSVDAMNFFLKIVLWVPPESDLLKARVCIWAFTAIVCSKEYFIFIDDPNCKKVGPTFWLSVYTILIEYSIWIKYAMTEFTGVPFPGYVKAINAIYFSIFIFGGIYSYLNALRTKGEEGSVSMKKTYTL